jgi:hypothetical protein
MTKKDQQLIWEQYANAPHPRPQPNPDVDLRSSGIYVLQDGDRISYDFDGEKFTRLDIDSRHGNEIDIDSVNKYFAQWRNKKYVDLGRIFSTGIYSPDGQNNEDSMQLGEDETGEAQGPYQRFGTRGYFSN